MPRCNGYGLVAVHGGGNRLFGDANSGSFCKTAFQVVCSLALVQFLVNDFHEFID